MALIPKGPVGPTTEGVQRADWDRFVLMADPPRSGRVVRPARLQPLMTDAALPFDAPEGSSLRTVALAIVAPKLPFERGVEAAAPVTDSVEFHGT